MTRINCIPVEELVDEHLRGEYKEITRVFTHVRKALEAGIYDKKEIPPTYRMGKGHVLFFYNKLLYISKRYHDLFIEMKRRGYSPNEDLHNTVMEDSYFFPDRTRGYWEPTEEAMKINRERINDRLKATSSR